MLAMEQKPNETEKVTPTCLFCGKSKNWRSDIKIVDYRGHVITEATVCPKCRGTHTILELYTESVARDLETMRKALKGAKL